MTLPHTALEKSLERLSHEISGAFSIAFFELETIRSTAAEFGTDIGALLDATVPQKTHEKQDSAFDLFLQNAGSAAMAAGSAADSLSDRAFQGSLIRISGSLLEMKKQTIALTSISSLTKITQSETRDLDGRLTTFTESLDGSCRDLREATARSANLVVETQHHSGLARDRLTAIGLEFRALSDTAGDEATRLARLEKVHHAYISEIRDDANRLDGEIKRAVSDLIGCLQFPDTFAQRTDHMRTAIAAMNTAAPGEKALLAKVIEAQLVQMSTALSEVAATASSALGTLRAAFEISPIIHNRSDAADPSDTWMTATAQANEVMLASVARAREQFGTALKLLSGLTRQIDATQDNLETSVQLNRELEISVHNASLVAHRSGSQTSPLRFLAGSVRDVVDRTSDLIAPISTALEHIRSTSEALTASSLDRDLKILLELQESAAQETEEQAQRLEQVRSIRRELLSHSDRLDGAAIAGSNAFDVAADYVPAIAGLAQQVRDIEATSEGAEVDLDWLYDLYTMEEERGVHRKVLGLPDIEETSEDSSEDLDDFLF